MSSSSRLRELNASLSTLGGRAAYQQASVITTARCSSSRWVIKVLNRREVIRPSKRPRLLEIGAINTELVNSKGLDVRAIDLLSSDPKIEQRDFFTLSVEDRRYDVIVASMVINCIPTPQG